MPLLCARHVREFGQRVPYPDPKEESLGIGKCAVREVFQ